MMIIDAWCQHPTLRHASDPMFDSLRRWTKAPLPTQELPVAATVEAMNRGKVDRALISAWVAPRNVMISNDEVAGFVAQAPDRLVGVGSVDISQTDDRRTGCPPLRDGTRLQSHSGSAVAVGASAH